MVSRDYDYLLSEIEKRLGNVEQEIAEMKKDRGLESQDWDNAELMRNWSISKRTAANYRKQGLQHFKRGGRVMYSLESREQFVNFGKPKCKFLNNYNNEG